MIRVIYVSVYVGSCKLRSNTDMLVGMDGVGGAADKQE